MNPWLGRALILLAAGALVLRLPHLDQRPLHNDEAVNATKIAALWEKGDYQYDPHEYHGPTLYYATLPILWLSTAKDSKQVTDAMLRLAPVFFGAGLVLLLGLTLSGLGRTATVVAAILLCISPAMVFYSRYFIHEMLLVFFTMLAIGSGWRYAQNRKLGWALLAGAAVGLMYATKETFVFNLAAMAFGIGAVCLPQRLKKSAGTAPVPCFNWKHLLAAAAMALVVAELFFTSFFTNLRGPLDAVLTYQPWINRAGASSIHNHEWYYYFEHLFWFHPRKSPVWTEGLIGVLALVGMIAGFVRTHWNGVSAPLVRFLTIYTLALTAIYCVIPYKTPWCLLGFLHGLILLAGVGTAFLFQLVRPTWSKFLVGAVLAAGTLQLGYQSWRASFPFASDRKNPYVYAQTSAGIFELLKKIEGVSTVHPDHTNMVIKVISKESYWPLPWYLRRFNPDRIGWYDELPPDPYAPVILVNAKFNAYLDEKSNKKYLSVGYYELRPNVFIEMYVDYQLWVKYVESLPKTSDE